MLRQRVRVVKEVDSKKRGMALLVAVQCPEAKKISGFETRYRHFYGLFGNCHGECGLVVPKRMN